MLHTILWVLGYFVVGYFLHYFLVPLIIATPKPAIAGWISKNHWVNWLDSWSELDSYINADGTTRTHIPYKHPVLQKLQIPLQLLLWPIDLLLTFIYKFIP